MREYITRFGLVVGNFIEVGEGTKRQTRQTVNAFNHSQNEGKERRIAELKDEMYSA